MERYNYYRNQAISFDIQFNTFVFISYLLIIFHIYSPIICRFYIDNKQLHKKFF